MFIQKTGVEFHKPWKKLAVRILFYSFILSSLCLVPVIYKCCFMTYGIIILELIGIIGIVLGTEYYLFVKLIKVEIDNKEWKPILSFGLIFLLFIISKLFILFLG